MSANQSPLQFGFTEGVSCNIVAMLLTESIFHAKDQGVLVYTTVMDASKAFEIWTMTLLSTICINKVSMATYDAVLTASTPTSSPTSGG